MAEPPIKMRLESAELTEQVSDAVRRRLNSCLASDPSHITPGQTGGHVKAVQDALNTLHRRLPDLGLLLITDTPGTYGRSTIAAVLKYKRINNIVRTGQALDNIVGRMTITQIDNDLVHATKPASPEPIIINAPIEIATVNDNLAKDDLTFRPVSSETLSGRQLISAIDMRKRTTPELEETMLSELRLGDIHFGPLLANDFFRNHLVPTGDSGITHEVGSPFSDFVASTAVWRALALDFRRQLDKHIKELGAQGPFDPLQLRGHLAAPVPSWSPRGLASAVAKGVSILGGLRTEDGKMLVLVGSFQGSRVFLHDFAMNQATRRYTGTLFYQLVDHFGIDTSDMVFDGRGHGTEGQIAFWVLQHERHAPGHMPYRLKVVIRELIDGSF